MKMLYLIRHAKSSWDHPELRDIDRPLGSRGLRDAPFMATMIRKEGVKPDKIVSSPARRAHTTAIFFANGLGMDAQEIVLNEDIYEAFGSDILRIANHWPDDWNTVFLFGHNPTFTTVANYFADEMIDNVPTCGIVAISLDADRWKDVERGAGSVLHFWYPKQFNR
ncbi:MAG: histidine phosphatase family protein [Saprospiraceae bacterium]